MILLVTYLLVALAFSFLCSLLEAVLLSVSPSHVAFLVERGTLTGKRLQRMKDDIDQPLAAILMLNTFAHTLGAAGVGAEAALLWGDAWVGVVSFIVTLLILIFSEIIPKTLESHSVTCARRAHVFVSAGWLWHNGIGRSLRPRMVCAGTINRATRDIKPRPQSKLRLLFAVAPRRFAAAELSKKRSF